MENSEQQPSQPAPPDLEKNSHPGQGNQEDASPDDTNRLDKREFEDLEAVETSSTRWPRFLGQFNLFHLLQACCLLLGAAFILSVVVSNTTVRLKAAPPVPVVDPNARVDLWGGWEGLEHHFVLYVLPCGRGLGVVSGWC